jgi:hypothetical protein
VNIDGAPRLAVRRHHWKRIHHSRLFWVGAFLFLAAITIYVLSDDLSWRPANAVSIGEAQYSSKIVGDWQGKVEGTRRSLITTCNQPFSEWDQIFPDPAMTVAAISRLVHHATILELNPESYRRRLALATGAKAVTARA